MKLNLILVSLLFFCLTACKKNVDRAPHSCENGFISQNNECVCPIEKHLYDNGSRCNSLKSGEFIVTDLDIPCFWFKTLIIDLPYVKNTNDVVGMGYKGEGHDRTTRNDGMAGYYHYPNENGIDSFSIRFLDRSTYCHYPDQWFILTGLNVNDEYLEETFIHFVDSGSIKSSYPVTLTK